MSQVSKIFTITDRVCDYVPVISTGTNLIDLFQKAVVLSHLSPEEIQSNHYYCHLNEKSIERCVSLLIPFIGNIFVVLWDLCPDFNDKAVVLDWVKSGWSSAYIFAGKFQADREVVLEAAKAGIVDIAFSNASKPFLKDREVALELAKHLPDFLLDESYKEFWNDSEIMTNAVTKAGSMIQVATNRLKNTFKVALAAVQSDPEAVFYLSPYLQRNTEIAIAVVSKNPELLGAFSDEIKNNKVVVREAIQKSPKALRYASKRLQSDNEILEIITKSHLSKPEIESIRRLKQA